MKNIFVLAISLLVLSSLQAKADGMYGYVTEIGTASQSNIEKLKTSADAERLREELCEEAKQDAHTKLDDDCRAQFKNDGEHGFTSDFETIGECGLFASQANTYSVEIMIKAKCSESGAE